MKLIVLHDERFTCHSCTDCCRQQFVELFTGEPQSIQQLAWPKTDPLHGIKGLVHHAGKTYLAHRPDGSCVFLNTANGLCRIHEIFGPQSKPMSCRLFPFQITPTFTGEAAVSARYDCPTVRANKGEPHSAALDLIREYTSRQSLSADQGFDENTRCHLDRESLTAVTEFLSTMLGGFDRNDERAMLIVFLADILSLTAVDEVNRPALAALFAPLKTQIQTAAAQPAKKPGLIARMAFRTLLALYLRRDEDILNHRASRFARLCAMTAFVLGFGSFHSLGLLHPPGPLRAASLFKPKRQPDPQPTPETFALLWRLVRNKLESFAFMGSANGNRDFLTGLRSLALLYPLTLAAAKHHAASRRSTTIDPADVDYATAVIEHSFGRSAVLSKNFLHSIETLLLDRATYTRLIKTI